MEKMIPWKVRSFFHDFKPIGNLDFDLSLSRPSYQPDDVHISGHIIGKGCSAEYYKFPYRVKDITGTVDITNGRFQLNQLHCATDSGTVTVSGTISDPTQYSEVTLNIESKRTALDHKLRNALTSQYQAIFDQFSPTGFADTHIELHNPPGGDQPWETHITAQLLDVSAVYENFRYPANHISGLLKISDNTLELTQLAGRHGQAEFTLSGTVKQLTLRILPSKSTYRPSGCRSIGG